MGARFRHLRFDERGLSYAFVGVSFMTVFTATTLAIDVGVYTAARNQAQRSAQARGAGRSRRARIEQRFEPGARCRAAGPGRCESKFGDGDSGLDSIIRRDRGHRRGRSVPTSEGLRLSNQRTAQPRSHGHEVRCSVSIPSMSGRPRRPKCCRCPL